MREKRMRKKKCCIAQFTFYDRTGIAAYLEKMARKGWMLEKVNNFFSSQSNGIMLFSMPSSHEQQFMRHQRHLTHLHENRPSDKIYLI